MFSKANLVATIVGFIILFFGGWIFYDMIAASFFDSHTTEGAKAIMRAEPNMLFIALGCLIQAFVMSTVYSKWARGIHSAKEGFEFGAWIGLFLGFGVWILMYGVMDADDMTARAVDGVWSIIHYGIIGMSIALVYKGMAKKE
ncbi:hypothetical protein [Leptobacterium sp. I13]|uniref:hypothetical protein n=1 Tax=Leptobacterium meishanense TaxID=3128904 RepID=UPI0030EDBBD6